MKTALSLSAKSGVSVNPRFWLLVALYSLALFAVLIGTLVVMAVDCLSASSVVASRPVATSWSGLSSLPQRGGVCSRRRPTIELQAFYRLFSFYVLFVPHDYALICRRG